MVAENPSYAAGACVPYANRLREQLTATEQNNTIALTRTAYATAYAAYVYIIRAGFLEPLIYIYIYNVSKNIIFNRVFSMMMQKTLFLIGFSA